MSLKSNARFAQAPSVKISRSRFDRSHDYKTTWNLGDLVPFYWDEILPGDTVDMEVSSVVRMSTPIKPIMDNVVMDIHFFFVPNRLLYYYWKNVMGELEPTDVWRQSVERTVPQLTFPGSASSESWYKEVQISAAEFNNYQTEVAAGTYVGMTLYKRTGSGPYTYTPVAIPETYSSSAIYCYKYEGWGPKSLSAYLGLPIGCSPMLTASTQLSINELPLRAYCKVWNEFYRDQNYMLPCDDGFGSNGHAGKNYRQGNWTNNTGINPSANYDYITDTVKGAKLLRVSRFHDYFSSALPEPQRGDPVEIPIGGSAPIFDAGGFASRFTPQVYNNNGGKIISHPLYTNSDGLSVDLNTTLSGTTRGYMDLAADLSAVVGQSTINDLRTAFQVQKFLETYARSGTRYIEVIRGFFGVQNPDYRLQRPEYLGGCREYLNVSQVLQTSSTDSTSPQGNTAAYSLTVNKNKLFTKSFTEHGILMGFVSTRVTHSYQQGFNRMWRRKRKYDFAWPQFAHLGNDPIYNTELYCYAQTDYQATNVAAFGYNDGVFSYQEKYSEYRYYPNLVTGDFASVGPQPLDFWHFADYYKSAPYASMDWLLEGPEILDRCLAVTSELSDQFIGDFYFKTFYTRALPTFSVPGLADHF